MSQERSREDNLSVDSELVCAIVRKLKRGKALGISNEMMKFGGRRLVESMCDMFSVVCFLLCLSS